jgi:signal transduction histidine kinase
MRLPEVVRSIRFRLSGMTSAVVFGIGALSLGALYVAVLWQVRSATMRRLVLTNQPFELADGRTVLLPQISEEQVRSFESVFSEIVLNKVASVTLVVMVGLFLLSLAVGWFFAGRALRPVDRITAVAHEIEATDLSRRIGLEGPDDELTRLARTFDAMLDRLDRAFQSQRGFLAQTSHDLRTPLAVIRSNLDVTLDDPDADLETWRETGEIVGRAAERMSGMIDGLLAAARLEAGAVALVETDLGDVVGATVEEFAARFAEASVGIRAVAEPAIVEGDATALTRALGNLVENALRVSPAGGAVTVSCGPVGDWAHCSVTDRGPGVDPALVTGTKVGPGLGLRIVQEIAGVHGGKVTSQPRTGGGSVVTIWLPRAGADVGEGAPPFEGLGGL